MLCVWVAGGWVDLYMLMGSIGWAGESRKNTWENY